MREKAKTLEDMQRVSRWMCLKCAFMFVMLALASTRARDNVFSKFAQACFSFKEGRHENPAGQSEIQPPQGL